MTPLEQSIHTLLTTIRDLKEAGCIADESPCHKCGDGKTFIAWASDMQAVWEAGDAVANALGVGNG